MLGEEIFSALCLAPHQALDEAHIAKTIACIDMSPSMARL